jgi:hypothetical protein
MARQQAQHTIERCFHTIRKRPYFGLCVLRNSLTELSSGCISARKIRLWVVEESVYAFSIIFFVFFFFFPLQLILPMTSLINFLFVTVGPRF